MSNIRSRFDGIAKMKSKAIERIYRACFLAVVKFLTGIATGCGRHRPGRLSAALQPDGWSAQPIAITDRFASDADIHPATGTPVGDEGYYLYILTESANWDFGNPKSLLLSIWRRPWAHAWLILESPGHRLECGHTGDFGLVKPRYHEGVMQGMRNGNPNPIAYLWQTMSDGEFQTGKPPRPPTFVWRMPITQCRYQLIHDYVMSRKYDQFGVRTENCGDLVAETAVLAGINLTNRIRFTMPPDLKILGWRPRVWTDPQYRTLELSTPEVLEVDLRQLAQMGIGSDVTGWYLAWKH